MADHFAGRKTFYFTSDGRSSVPEVLVNIDIDCHKSGSLAGAIAFAEHLRDTLFPGLYFEASTNGNGVHGYIVVVKGDLGDEGLNGALSVLDRWLKAELSQGKWDVENVEVKGHCPRFGWGWNKFELKTYKSGQLAKLPREAVKRADELRSTTRITVDELRRLKVPVADESNDSAVIKLTRLKRPRLDVVDGGERKQAGSIACRHFGEDELSRLDGCYLSLAKDLLGETKLIATGRKFVAEEDMAIFLMLLRFFTNNMNADGTLPTARWKEMWSALHEAGDIERGWCHHRHATMRNFLTKNSLLAWEDEDFVVGTFDENGRFVPGRAAKWRAGEELMAMIEGVGGDGNFGIVQDVVVHVEEEEERNILYGCKESDQDKPEELEEGRSILYGCKEQEHDHQDKEGEGESILYGCNISQSPVIPTSPRQSEALRDVLIHLGIDLPLSRPRFAGYSWGQSRMAA